MLAVLLVLAALPGVVAAQAADSTRAGGTVTVDEGETVDGNFVATGGTVVVAGRVTGDAEVTAGTVIVTRTGVVEGDLRAFAGSVILEGDVGGDASIAAGSLLVREGAIVAGALEAAAGDVRVNGRVDGDARFAGETVTLGPSAVVGGGVEYDAETFTADPDARVAGTVTRTDDVAFASDFGAPGFVGGFDVPSGAAIPRGFFAAWGLVVNLLVGAAAVALLPRFTAEVTDAGLENTLKSGGVGLLAVIAVPVLLVVLLVTIVGIPLSLVGALAFALVLWLTAVYGSLILGTWLLSLVDRESVWGALVLGLVAFTALEFVPFVGELLQLVLVLVGLGAFVLAANARRRDPDDAVTPPGEESGSAGGEGPSAT